jgi:hypothetical protein
LTERNVPATPKNLDETKTSAKGDTPNALLGFLASGESQVGISSQFASFIPRAKLFELMI